ncbi:hypothetical protein QYE76_019137 [Lolium multiflorum]|uniref:Uncharacterized protein n=1 Tax=Lolium multiflorum TaxID=4521 RepID=A0AAD8R2C2_LOLMU|nr:hypothetical protein QYE76_019137 [Lolium multiflorum]
MRRLLRWKREGPGRGGGRCAGCYVGSRQGRDGGGGDARLLRWKQRQADGRRRCAGCYVGSSDRLDGAAADAPTMGISFFSIAGGFLRVFLLLWRR